MHGYPHEGFPTGKRLGLQEGAFAMKNVTIRRCPVCTGIKQHAASLAVAIRKEPWAKVEVVDGDLGELTVLVDGREVARKKGDSKPTSDEALAALRKAEPAGAR
jgi:hypothetical protein